MHDPRYLQFIELFNRQEFFEAHEVLEDLWRETEGEDRDFYQGLIQLAACLVHRQKGNRTGSERLIASAARYLGGYSSPMKELDLPKTLEKVRACALESADFPRLYLKVS